VNLHKSPYLSLEVLIIPSFPYIPKKKENLGQGLMCGIGRKEIRQYILDTILSGINKMDERGDSRMIPNSVRQMTEEEEV
jgi:hypothetical protein